MEEQDYGAAPEMSYSIDVESAGQSKIKFYFMENKKIKFKLLDKPNYQFNGSIQLLFSEYIPSMNLSKSRIIKDQDSYERIVYNKNCISNSFILNSNGIKMIFDFSEIDPSTIMPISIDPHDYLYNSEPIKEEDRNLVMENYQNHCAYNLEGCDIRATEIDHVIPRALGGSSHISNLAPACSNCNKKKGTKLLKPFPPEVIFKKR